MAHRKRNSKRSQPRHKKSKASRHDKRARLDRPNPNRRQTTRARIPLSGALATALAALAAMMHRRIAFRWAIIVAGMLLADDRRTASAWFAAAGLLDDWDCFYACLISLGLRSRQLATVLLTRVVTKFDPGPDGRFLLGLDDTPTQRYGRHVEGAGVHHHPTPGPADGEWLYGHNWVTLALLAKHRLWGVIALPLRSLLYVRQVDVPKLDEKHGWEFQTKHQLAAKLVLWFVVAIRSLGMQAKLWLAVDGAYAAQPFLEAVLAQGVVVVSRLRKDAALFDLPPERPPGQRGRPRKYGARLSLAKRAAHPQGWQSIPYCCRGAEVTGPYKTLLASSRLVGGVIRVVLVRFEDGGWIAYFCSDCTAEVRDILEAAASRWALEEQLHDVKQVCGAGQQQVRNVWSNIGCWHLKQWLFTLVELCSWEQDQSSLSDRRDRPWDNAARRPSHAERRRAIARELLRNEFPSTPPSTPETKKYRTLVETLLSLCT